MDWIGLDRSVLLPEKMDYEILYLSEALLICADWTCTLNCNVNSLVPPQVLVGVDVKPLQTQWREDGYISRRWYLILPPT